MELIVKEGSNSLREIRTKMDAFLKEEKGGRTLGWELKVCGKVK